MTEHTTLAALRIKFETARELVDEIIGAEFPGMDTRCWLLAVSHVAGGNIWRNDDTSHDEALAAHTGIKAAWDEYITALHAYYALRGGPRGFLGNMGVPTTPQTHA